MFQLLQNVFKFLAEAVYTYAASEQGNAELIAIADEAEALGIDIPFYQPSQPVEPTTDASAQAAQAADAAYAARHPNGK